jgi:hypothetical protein
MIWTTARSTSPGIAPSGAAQSAAVAGSHWPAAAAAYSRGAMSAQTCALRPLGADRRPARLDERAAGGQAPALVGARFRDAAGVAGPHRAQPAAVARASLDDDQRRCRAPGAASRAVGHGSVRDAVAVLAAPGGEVDAKCRVPAGDGQPLARSQPGERPGDQQVPALVESQVAEIGEFGGWHRGVTYGRYPAAVISPFSS